MYMEGKPLHQQIFGLQFGDCVDLRCDEFIYPCFVFWRVTSQYDRLFAYLEIRLLLFFLLLY